MQIDKHSLSGLMLNYSSFLNTKYLTGKMKELWLIEDSICDYQGSGEARSTALMLCLPSQFRVPQQNGR